MLPNVDLMVHVRREGSTADKHVVQRGETGLTSGRRFS